MSDYKDRLSNPHTMTTPQSMRERIIDHCDLRDYGLDEAEVQALAADIEDLLAAARAEERNRIAALTYQLPNDSEQMYHLIFEGQAPTNPPNN